jgi:hypothetical protein
MVENLVLYVLISTAITRTGAVLLLVFGAQVLINFYRYNLRLAAFYDSRADALELLGDGELSDLGPLVSAFSVDQITSTNRQNRLPRRRWTSASR